MNDEHLPICMSCYAVRVEYPRRHMKRPTCMACGEQEARQVKHTIAPMNKSNYIHINDPETLTQLNPKRESDWRHEMRNIRRVRK
jgi:hypothetical protein